MTSPAYYRAWRAAHPAYRAREAVRRKARVRGDRTGEYVRRNARLAATRGTPEPLPTAFHGHPLFEAARAVVGRDRSGLTILQDPLYEDLLSVAVVALVEGTDPVEAVKRCRSAEGAWRRITAPFLMEGLAA